MTTKVKLRTKPISGNRQSLYLDFYPAIPDTESGKLTRRQFLGLYLFDKQNTLYNKQHNKDTKTIAETIRQKRENELNKPEIYTEFEKEQLRIKENGKLSFIEYFKELADKRKSSNHDNWMSALNYLELFTGKSLKFADITQKFCNDFKDHLLSTESIKSKKSKATLSQNSAVSYFNKFKAALKQAFKDEYFQVDLNAKIPSIKTAETHRTFLTIEELNKLVKTDCSIPVLKKAALFSALTGFRFSDIEKLLWNEIEYISGNGYFIKFKQQKTKGVEMMPISIQAYEILGNPKNPEEKVFMGLLKSDRYYAFYQWIGSAGITKKVKFHGLRHSYAILQLSGGTDIYTVSKMLGHRELKTTQIYAKVIDATKRQATEKIKLDF